MGEGVRGESDEGSGGSEGSSEGRSEEGVRLRCMEVREKTGME